MNLIVSTIRNHLALRKILLASALLASAALSGCAGSTYQDSPVGAGPGATDLKQSPCACITIPNQAAPPKTAG